MWITILRPDQAGLLNNIIGIFSPGFTYAWLGDANTALWAIIIAASGMAEAGRILHHLANGATDPRNTILIVGFQAEHTLGRRIVERRPMIKVFGEEMPLRARVEVLNGYSAHADRRELNRWIDGVASGGGTRKPPVCLVHGEPPSQDALASQMSQRGFQVRIPAPGDEVKF